jgi:hypothetical protein
MPESTSNRGCTHITVVLNLSKGVSSLLEESGEAMSYTGWTVASELLLGMWEGCYVGSVIMHYQHPLRRYGYIANAWSSIGRQHGPPICKHATPASAAHIGLCFQELANLAAGTRKAETLLQSF